MIRGSLSADPDVFSRIPTGRDRLVHQRLDGLIAFIELIGHQARIAIKSKRQLREIVGSDRQSIEVLSEFPGQYRV